MYRFLKVGRLSIASILRGTLACVAVSVSFGFRVEWAVAVPGDEFGHRVAGFPHRDTAKEIGPVVGEAAIRRGTGGGSHGLRSRALRRLAFRSRLPYRRPASLACA